MSRVVIVTREEGDYGLIGRAWDGWFSFNQTIDKECRPYFSDYEVDCNEDFIEHYLEVVQVKVEEEV
jgi:hypothetical protein